MKLPASVLATLCAVGCEAAYTTEPAYPSQPVEVYEVADPRIETIEPIEQIEQIEQIAPREFAKPPEAGVAPVRPRVQRRVVPPPPPPIPHIDDCPGCGLG